MLRELHAAATGFDPSTVDEMVRLRAGEVMSHGDLGPWNTVYRDGRPVALIDWDACGPVDPMVDVAGAAWSYVPLAPDNRLAEIGFDPLPDIAQRLRLFVDSYGVTDRTAILPALVKSMLGAAAQVRHWQLGATDSAVALEFIANELRWLGANSARIERALL
jgi:aminoglycoside phosphotransferase (APT) family kinase protein